MHKYLVERKGLVKHIQGVTRTGIQTMGLKFATLLHVIPASASDRGLVVLQMLYDGTVLSRDSLRLDLFCAGW